MQQGDTAQHKVPGPLLQNEQGNPTVHERTHRGKASTFGTLEGKADRVFKVSLRPHVTVRIRPSTEGKGTEPEPSPTGLVLVLSESCFP